jgi:DnaJ-class molecular chaperone
MSVRLLIGQLLRACWRCLFQAPVETCWHCDGTGRGANQTRCELCDGTGRPP